MNSFLFIAVLVWYAKDANVQSTRLVVSESELQYRIERIFRNELQSSLDIYKAVAKSQPSSFALSTFDASLGLSILRLGANGRTESEISKLIDLSYDDVSSLAMNVFLNRMKRTTKFRFYSDNRIILKNDLLLEYDFTFILSLLFGLKAQTVALANGTTVAGIFQSAPGDASGYPINLFGENDSFVVASEANFTLNAGSGCLFEAPFTRKNLSKSENYRYIRMVKDFKYGEIATNEHLHDGEFRPFVWLYIELASKTNGTAEIKTFIILPDDVRRIADVEQYISAAVVRSMFFGSDTYRIDVRLPANINIDSSIDLAEPFSKHLNVKEMFTERANFSKITATRPIKVDLFLNNMLFTTVWKIDPVMCDLDQDSSSTPAEKIFYANRPFIILTAMKNPHISILSMARFDGLEGAAIYAE